MATTDLSGELAHLAIAPRELPSLAWASPSACELHRVEPVRRQYYNKPLGGLWLSPLSEDRRSSGWLEWLRAENWTPDETPLSSYLVQEVSLRSDARVLRVDTWEDFTQILSAYLLLPENPVLAEVLKHQYVDFEAMAEDWDAFYLTEEGQWNTRFGPSWHSGPSLYGWDLESVLILRPEAIRSVGRPYAAC